MTQKPQSTGISLSATPTSEIIRGGLVERCGDSTIVKIRGFVRAVSFEKVDRARSPARVSQKREYFICGPETIGDFTLRLFNLGVQRQRSNSQKAPIGGHVFDLSVSNL